MSKNIIGLLILTSLIIANHRADIRTRDFQDSKLNIGTCKYNSECINVWVCMYFVCLYTNAHQELTNLWRSTSGILSDFMYLFRIQCD
jgi:hypothetical protein